MVSVTYVAALLLNGHSRAMILHQTDELFILYTVKGCVSSPFGHHSKRSKSVSCFANFTWWYIAFMSSITATDSWWSLVRTPSKEFVMSGLWSKWLFSDIPLKKRTAVFPVLPLGVLAPFLHILSLWHHRQTDWPFYVLCCFRTRGPWHPPTPLVAIQVAILCSFVLALFYHTTGGDQCYPPFFPLHAQVLWWRVSIKSWYIP